MWYNPGMDDYFTPIAHIYTDLPEKFGIPRQSGLAPGLSGRIVFAEPFRDARSLRGIEGYDYLWLLWRFDGTDADRVRNAQRRGAGAEDLSAELSANRPSGDTGVRPSRFRPLVRPPRLGGNEYMGVFATRSPFRPNPIGLSCVKLEKVAGDELLVSGADLRSGTALYDIKPYLPYADAHPNARGGFGAELAERRLSVDFPPELLARIPEEKQAALLELLALDPRPAYHDDPERVYGIRYASWDVRFTVEGERVWVREVEVWTRPD